MKAGAVNSKSFVTHGAADVLKIVGVRQEKSDLTNAPHTTVSVSMSALCDKLVGSASHRQARVQKIEQLHSTP